MNEFELDLLQLSARMTTGYAGWRDVEAVGLKLLLGGMDGPAVVALASVSSDEGNLPTLVREAVSELHLREPTMVQVAAVRMHDVAHQVLEQGLDPYEGAKKISNLAFDFPELYDEVFPYEAMAAAYEDEESLCEVHAQDITEHLRPLLTAIVFTNSSRADGPTP